MQNIAVCGLKNNLTATTENAWISYTLSDTRKGAKQTAVEVAIFSQGKEVARVKEQGENNYCIRLPKLCYMTNYVAKITATTVADGKEKIYEGEVAFRTEPDYSSLPAKWIDCQEVEGVLSPAHAGYESGVFDNAFARPNVTVDLGSVKSAEYAVVYGARPFDVPCQPDAPGMKFPIAFTLESATKEDFSDAVTVYKSADPYPNPGNQPTFFPLNNPLRYLRFTADKMQRVSENGYAFALEQISVLNGIENLAEGCAVTATSSVETEFYGKQKLTDGSTEFHPAGRAKKLPQPQFFRPFTLKGKAKEAYLYTTALGLYSAKLNGKQVGNEYLAAEWSEFLRYANVLCHDVTDSLIAGDNILEVQAADGWYAGRIGMANVFGERVLRGIYGEDRPKIWAYLTVTYENGDTDFVATDSAFLCTAQGALRSSDIYDGEVYDARCELSSADFPRLVKEGALSPAREFTTEAKPLSQINEPVRVIRTLPEVSRHVGADGRLVLDFGVNFAGVATFEIDLPKGAVVRFIYSQHLRKDGTCYVANMRGAKPIDTFISAGKKVRYTPRFTYHGFRYVSVLGASSEQIPFAEGLQLSSDMQTVGEYHFDNDLINKFTEATVNTLRSNFVGVQTDVPDRDERLPWRMDGYHNSLYFLNSTPFFERNIFESTISPCPEGKRPGHLPRALNMYCTLSRADSKQPLFHYRLTGNDAPIRQNYAFLRSYMLDLEKKFPDGILNTAGTPDWLNSDMIDAPGIPVSGAQIGWDEYSTFDYAESVKMFAELAEILGEEEDVKLFNDRLALIKRSIAQKLLSADKKTRTDTQTSYAMLLFRNLVEEEDIPTVAQHYYDAIKRYNDRVSCGVYVIDEVLGVLTMLGKHDLALELAFEPRFPSLGYMIDQGATSIWERWDTYLHTRPDVHEKLRWQAPKGSCLTFINEAGCAGVSMNSFNHLEMTSSSRFLIERVLGLRLGTAPAASRMQAVIPTGGYVHEASGKYLTARGLSALHWKKEGGEIAVELTVPLGCTMTLSVPCQTLTDLDDGTTYTPANSQTVKTNSPLERLELSDKITITLPSGTYRFKGE